MFTVAVLTFFAILIGWFVVAKVMKSSAAEEKQKVVVDVEKNQKGPFPPTSEESSCIAIGGGISRGFVKNGEGLCVCPDGYQVYTDPETGDKFCASCDSDKEFSFLEQKCVCKDAKIENENGKCQFLCNTDTEYADENGNCICKEGFEQYQGVGSCVKKCKSDESLSGEKCVCSDIGKSNECGVCLQKCPADKIMDCSAKKCVDCPTKTNTIVDCPASKKCVIKPQNDKEQIYDCSREKWMCKSGINDVYYPDVQKCGPVCNDDEKLDPSSGKCICKVAGYLFNEKCGKCTVAKCPADSEYSCRNDECVCKNPNFELRTCFGETKCSPKCPSGSVYDCDSRSCVCPSGEEYLNFSNTCEKKCPVGLSRDQNTGECVCGNGKVGVSCNGTTRCVDPCPQGTGYSCETNRCSCPSGDSKCGDKCCDASQSCISDKCCNNPCYLEDGTRICCPSGMICDNSLKKCVIPCPQGSEYSSDCGKCIQKCPVDKKFNCLTNKCECLDGLVSDCNGDCYSKCPAGTRRDCSSTSKDCVCPEGLKDYCGDGTCRSQCPSGLVFDCVNKRCVCPIEGQELINGVCSLRCNDDQIWSPSDQKCVCKDSKAKDCNGSCCIGECVNKKCCIKKCTDADGTVRCCSRDQENCPSGTKYDEKCGKCLKQTCPSNSKVDCNNNCVCNDPMEVYLPSLGKCVKNCDGTTGSTLDKTKNVCVCPTNFSVVENPTANNFICKGNCSRDSVWNSSSKSCVCKTAGYVYRPEVSGNDKCDKSCPSGSIYDPESRNCVCSTDNQIYDEFNQKCRIKCSGTSKYDRDTDSCKCPSNLLYRNGNCSCPENTKLFEKVENGVVSQFCSLPCTSEEIFDWGSKKCVCSVGNKCGDKCCSTSCTNGVCCDSDKFCMTDDGPVCCPTNTRCDTATKKCAVACGPNLNCGLSGNSKCVKVQGIGEDTIDQLKRKYNTNAIDIVMENGIRTMYMCIEESSDDCRMTTEDLSPFSINGKKPCWKISNTSVCSSMNNSSIMNSCYRNNKDENSCKKSGCDWVNLPDLFRFKSGEQMTDFMNKTVTTAEMKNYYGNYCDSSDSNDYVRFVKKTRSEGKCGLSDCIGKSNLSGVRSIRWDGTTCVAEQNCRKQTDSGGLKVFERDATSGEFSEMTTIPTDELPKCPLSCDGYGDYNCSAFGEITEKTVFFRDDGISDLDKKCKSMNATDFRSSKYSNRPTYTSFTECLNDVYVNPSKSQSDYTFYNNQMRDSIEKKKSSFTACTRGFRPKRVEDSRNAASLSLEESKENIGCYSLSPFEWRGSDRYHEGILKVEEHKSNDDDKKNFVISFEKGTEVLPQFPKHYISTNEKGKRWKQAPDRWNIPNFQSRMEGIRYDKWCNLYDGKRKGDNQSPCYQTKMWNDVYKNSASRP